MSDDDQVLNREDELGDGEPGAVRHTVTAVFSWIEYTNTLEGVMDSIDGVDSDPIGAAIDAYLDFSKPDAPLGPDQSNGDAVFKAELIKHEVLS